ncbi:MAG TPA: S41 family peptidase [Thermoanaerobaculia bacterium]
MRILSLLSLLFTLTAFAGQSVPQQVLESTAFVIEESFVIPDRGIEIARALRTKQIPSDLTGKALADAITNAIWSIEDDGHLNVRFDPTKADTPLASKDEIRERLEQRGPMLPPNMSDEPQVSSRMEGSGGVIELLSFERRPGAEEAIAAAMAKLAGARSIIVDLRKNRGGSQFVVDFLASYFFPQDHGVLIRSHFRGMPHPLVSYVVPTPTREFENVPVAILISEKTFSAGEAFAYVLQQFGRAEVIGTKTRGGGRPNRFVDIGAGYVVSVSIGASEHPKTGKGWQTTGVIPDVPVKTEEALSVAMKRLKK